MAGSCRLLCGIGFGASHLSHTDNLRVKTQSHVKEHVLIDVLLFILAESGQRMDHAIGYLSILFPYQSQLPASVFNGKNSLVVRNGGKEPPCQCSLAGAGGACHTDADAIPQTLCQKIQHFFCCSSSIHKVALFQTLWIYDSDGGCNTHILIHKGRL